MANEARGLLYEAITEEAVDRAISKVGISGQVWWNEKPEGMSIDPDVTVGEEKDDPSHVILVAAVGSARNAEMKSWRNLGEMFEVKAQLPRVPIVISLYFKSVVKKRLADAMGQLYDVVMHVEEKPYYPYLAEWVDDHIADAVKTRDDKRALLEADIGDNSALETALGALATDLADALQTRNEELQTLWELMKEDYEDAGDAPTRRETSVRRGLAKLIVLEPDVRQRLYDSLDNGNPVQNLPEYAFDLGFFVKTMGGGRLVDSEIRNALELLGVHQCEELLDKAPSKMDKWINQLRQLDNISSFVDFAKLNFDEITDPSRLAVLLQRCQQDPEQFAQDEGVQYEGSLTRNWLFSFIIDLIKASTGRQQGYGYSKLAEEVGRQEGISSGYISIADWVNRVDGAEIPDEMLEGVSRVLASKISDIGIGKIDTLADKIVDFTERSFLNARIIPYRKFEPLPWMLKSELKRQDKDFVEKKPYGGWIREYTDASGRTATTPFIRVGTTLVHWKTVSDSGRSHKKKELSGRARNVKYQYHPDASTFTRREGVDELALIVDGTFREEDLDVLVKSGWDRIVYPDEIADFVSEL